MSAADVEPGRTPDTGIDPRVGVTPPDKICVGGAYDQSDIVYACQSNDDCPGTCDAGPYGGDSCTSNYDCNYFCAGGTNVCEDDPERLCGEDNPCPGVCRDSGRACTTNADCGRTCAGGPNGGAACQAQADCPGECIGGEHSGERCSRDADCAGRCQGGWQTGEVLCTSDEDCPGGCELDGTPCFNSHDLCESVCQGGTMDGESCQQDVAGCLDGGGSCLPGCCHPDGICENPGTCRLDPCTNDDVCVPGNCRNHFFECLGRGRCVDPDDAPHESTL